MENIVYVVHCIDTEGPLYEEFRVPFDMVKNIFGIEIAPTKDNLISLQQGRLNLNGKENDVQKIVDIHRITTRGNWDEIFQMLHKVTSEEFRFQLLDNDGKGWIFNWFCMDHAGFNGKNPRYRDSGYHHIFDKYNLLIKEQKSDDFIGFHYHPIPISGNYNDSGTSYWGGENLNQILLRKIIDRGWFPAAFRPGFHTERPDSNWFLEQWIPFDYANQSTKEIETGQDDLSNGRFGDWRHAPLEWRPYHPAHDDYQDKGSCRRWITRCLNMYARTRQISQNDVDDAFADAKKYGKSILAFTDHDYKDMEFEINRIREFIINSKAKYPDVKFVYSNAVDAMRNCMDLEYQNFELETEVQPQGNNYILKVSVDNDIFGPQPFLAIKTKDNRYIWENFDVSVKGRKWTYTFDANTILLPEVDVIGVAANNSYGMTKVVTILEKEKRQFHYN